MSLSELEELQERLEKLKDSRGKVDEEERQSTMRTTRKRIRRLKKNIASKSKKALSISGNGHEEVPLDGKEVPPKKKLKRKRKSKKAARENKLVILSPVEQSDFLDQLTDFFKEEIPWSDPEVLGEAIGYGYSGSLIIDEVERWAYSPEVMAHAIVEKYKQRWDDTTPDWFTVYFQGETPIFCFGPVPDTTNLW